MLKDDVTILINSCDSYSDCWYPFFKLWYDFFPDHSLRIILNTESKTFSFDGLNIECMQLYKPGERPAFGNQMNSHIDMIKTPYVITMLEDFFLNSPVDMERIEKCLDFMKNDESIAAFYFTENANSMNSKVEGFEGFLLKDKVVPYKINTMGALWRTESLRKYSIPNSTPWEWEYYGSICAFDSDDKFFNVEKGKSPIMNYANVPPIGKKLGLGQLWGIVRGKWVVESVDKLFKEHEITVDYSERGELKLEELSNRMKAELSVPLNELVGDKITKDIIKFEKKKKLFDMIHREYYPDYIQYRRAKVGLPVIK